MGSLLWISYRALCISNQCLAHQMKGAECSFQKVSLAFFSDHEIKSYANLFLKFPICRAKYGAYGKSLEFQAI